MKCLLASAVIAVCFVAQACAPATPARLALSPATVTPVIPTEYIPTPVPVTPTSAGCTHVLGSKDLPDLSTKLNTQLQKISMDVSALAYAYGEKCIYSDGHETFSAAETDFRIGVKVVTVNDLGTLGDWIYKVMPIVLSLPADQLQGTQPGRVDFSFQQPDPAKLFVTVPIEKYRNEADNLRGAELLHLFYPNP